MLTIDSAGLEGQQGLLVLSYTIDGTVVASGSADPFGVLDVSVGENLEQLYFSPFYQNSVIGCPDTNLRRSQENNPSLLRENDPSDPESAGCLQG